MCGIVGVVGQIFKKEEDIFADLLRVDVLRGPDSTGVATMKGNGTVAMFKDIVFPDELIASKEYRGLFWGKLTAVIGHNRWATRGRVTEANAHPFTSGKITGVHNGTLTNQSLLPDHRKFVVDSENIMYSLDKEGVDDTVGNLLGAYCLVWVNSEDNTINFIRNKERPLFLTHSEDGNTLFYASEGWMLAGVLGRHGKKHKDIWALPVDQLFTYKLGGGLIPMDKPHVRKLEGRLPPPPPAVKQLPLQRTDGRNVWGGGGGRSVMGGGSLSVGGVKWDKGDLIDFRVASVTRVSVASPMWKVLGKTIVGGGQLTISYVREGHYLLKKLKEGIGDVFNGHITSLWFDERNTLNLMLGPETLASHHTVLFPGLSQMDAGDAEFTEVTEKEEKGQPIVDRDGNEISVAAFAALTKKGCAWCTDVAMPEQSADLVWLDCDEFICKDCADTTQVKEYLEGVSQYTNGVH